MAYVSPMCDLTILFQLLYIFLSFWGVFFGCCFSKQGRYNFHIVQSNGNYSVLAIFDFLSPFNTLQ